MTGLVIGVVAGLVIAAIAARSAERAHRSAAHANYAMARTQEAVDEAIGHLVRDDDPIDALAKLHRAAAEIEADRVKRGLVRG